MVEPVPPCTADFPARVPFPILIRAHTGRWIKGQAEQFSPSATGLFIKAEDGIDEGTSGGPCLTEDGLLLGVVSKAGGPSGAPATEVPLWCLHLALPADCSARCLIPTGKP